MGSATRLHVFLSYRTVEVRFADTLKTHLDRDFIGLLEIFIASDTTSVPAGTHWLEEIVAGLQKAELQLILCSSDSVQRPWINYEAGAARVRGIPSIPLCHSGLTPGQLPVPLSESEGVVLTDAGALRKLYIRIAALIGSSVPEVDFEKYAEQFRVLEREIAPLNADHASGDAAGELPPELIREPHVLCVTSPQFRELGFDNQLQLVLDAFPKNVRHDFVFSSAALRDILLRERVDIVHVAAFVCPRGGDLYFSPVELPLGKSTIDEPDVLDPDAFVAMLEKARTRLVVLGGSASLILAAQLLSVTNVIAARDMVSPKAMATWVGTFYRALPTEPLSDASALASRVSQAPMVLYAQQRRGPSLRFGRTEET